MSNVENTENYDKWVERVMSGREAKPLIDGEIIKSSTGEPFGPVQFVKVECKGFTAEVGKRGGLYIYHFYPTEDNSRFESVMGDAFLSVFKRPDQIQASWEVDMGAWAVKVSGFVETVWGDELAVRVIDVLEEKLLKE